MIIYDARHWDRGGIGEVITVHLDWFEQQGEGAFRSLILITGQQAGATKQRWPKLKIIIAPKLFSLTEQIFFAALCYRNPEARFVSPYLTFPMAFPQRSVIWVHDFIWIQRPRYASSRLALVYFFLLQYWAHYQADMRIYISRFTHLVARRIFGGIPSGIVVRNPVRPPTMRSSGVPPDGFGFLYLGNRKKWKNVPLLIGAFELLVRQDDRYVLTLVGGRKTNNDDSIDGFIGEQVRLGRIRDLGFVDAETKENELRRNTVVVVPSEIEGFGIPLIEAIQMRRRVVAARNTVAEELLGGLCTYFEIGNVHSLAEAMRSACGLGEYSAEERLWAQRIEAGFEPDSYKMKFGWILRDVAVDGGNVV